MVTAPSMVAMFVGRPSLEAHNPLRQAKNWRGKGRRHVRRTPSLAAAAGEGPGGAVEAVPPPGPGRFVAVGPGGVRASGDRGSLGVDAGHGVKCRARWLNGAAAGPERLFCGPGSGERPQRAPLPPRREVRDGDGPGAVLRPGAYPPSPEDDGPFRQSRAQQHVGTGSGGSA